MRNILIIGDGKIGKYISLNFNQNYKVYTVTRKIDTAKNIFFDFNSLEGDLHRLKQINFELVVFCIGILPSRLISKTTYFNVNSNSVNYLSNFIDRDVKFIYMSTVSVYGESIKNKFISESDIVKPKNLYAKSKLKGENITQNLFPNSYIFRIPPVFLDFNDKTIFKRIFKNKICELVFNNDQHAHSFCSLSFLNNAVVRVLDCKIKPDIFHICDHILKVDFLKNLIKIKPIFVIRINNDLFNLFIFLIKATRIKTLIHKTNEIHFKLSKDNIYSSKKFTKFIENGI